MSVQSGQAALWFANGGNREKGVSCPSLSHFAQVCTHERWHHEWGCEKPSSWRPAPVGLQR
eukprot:2955689-Amphidinium_carterae.1